MINDTATQTQNGIKFQYTKTMCCPRCGAYSTDDLKFVSLFEFSEGIYNLYAATECSKCRKPFFVVYFEHFKFGETMKFKTPIYYPKLDSKTEFDPTIRDISPDFVEIFNEAEIAEVHELKRMCGVGYRKAFEFLIKDYLCKCAPDKASDIQKSSLNHAINQIENEKIKRAASKARALGNDQVHYLKKYEAKDLDDLKDLISATVYWIMMEEITDQSLTP